MVEQKVRGAGESGMDFRDRWDHAAAPAPRVRDIVYRRLSFPRGGDRLSTVDCRDGVPGGDICPRWRPSGERPGRRRGQHDHRTVHDARALYLPPPVDDVAGGHLQEKTAVMDGCRPQYCRRNAGAGDRLYRRYHPKRVTVENHGFRNGRFFPVLCLGAPDSENKALFIPKSGLRLA